MNTRIDAESPDQMDILLWRDDFWCFRKDTAAAINRDSEYRVIRSYSMEWRGRTAVTHCDSLRSRALLPQTDQTEEVSA